MGCEAFMIDFGNKLLLEIGKIIFLRKIKEQIQMQK
jgi:hypothetical protein